MNLLRLLGWGGNSMTEISIILSPPKSFKFLNHTKVQVLQELLRQSNRKEISKADRQQPKHALTLSREEALLSRRRVMLCGGASLLLVSSTDSILAPLPVRAEEKNTKDLDDKGDTTIIDSVKSLFDPNEETKSGKVLPKAYLKSAREVVKTLRESLDEDVKNNAKFRRTADAAKESIREYLNSWRGQKLVVAEESYIALEKAIRSLAGFYSKAGPSAMLSEEVKTNILDDLNTADAAL